MTSEFAKNAVQALIEECLTTAHAGGVCHDGLDSEASKPLLEYIEELEKSDRHLNRLFARGVDNWEGYCGPGSIEEESDEDDDE